MTQFLQGIYGGSMTEEHKFLCGDSVHADIVRKTEERVRAEMTATAQIDGTLFREHCPACCIGGYYVCQHKVAEKVRDAQDGCMEERRALVARLGEQMSAVLIERDTARADIEALRAVVRGFVAKFRPDAAAALSDYDRLPERLR